MLEHLDWSDVAAKYAAGWGFKRLADHFTVNRNSMRIALGNRGLVRPYAERSITARAVRHADQRAQSLSWRTRELDAENAIWRTHELWWRQAHKRTSMDRYYADQEKSKERERGASKRRHQKFKNDPKYRLKRNQASRVWHEANKQRTKEYNKQWREDNPEKWKESARAARQRRKLSPLLRLKDNLRRRLKTLIRKGKAAHGLHHHQLIGCTRHHLLQHLQSLWGDGMSWANYGTHWHVDHIKPLAAFDLRDEEQCRAAMHYTNLQPLTAEENIRKGAWWQAA